MMAEYFNVCNRTLFIGDNLPFLRGINTDAVDLIYLDPPRNRGGVVRGRKYNGKYIEYNDTWTADDMRPEWVDEISVRCPDALLAINGAKLLHGIEMAGYLTFMTVRLLEMQRVLRPSGSIYLQSDPHTVHYFRAVMDAIFGSDNFKNQIAWRRNRIGRAGGMRWAWSHDTLLFYTGLNDKHHWNLIPQEPPPEYWKYYGYTDEAGLRYYTAPLVRQGLKEDGSSDPWGPWDPGKVDRYWEPQIAHLRRLYPEITNWAAVSVHERLDMLAAANMIHFGRARFPRLKRYEDSPTVTALQDIVTDVPVVSRGDREDRSWPEQKPEALVEYIIRASSNPADPTKKTDEAAAADIVLDPFCGSGTTCMVAERLGRRWIGIEQDERAGKILRFRLKDDAATVSAVDELSVTSEAPERTDIGSRAAVPSYGTTKATLYARQDGRCRGCNHQLPPHVLIIDRFKSPGRTELDEIENLALVCHHCRLTRLGDEVAAVESANFKSDIYKHD